MLEEFFRAVAAYPFLTRALAVGVLVGLCAALLGSVTLLVRRKKVEE